MIEAIRDAMDVMMARDDRVVVFGQDVGFFGGVSAPTQLRLCVTPQESGIEIDLRLQTIIRQKRYLDVAEQTNRQPLT